MANIDQQPQMLLYEKEGTFLFFQFPVEIMWIWGDIWLLLFCVISFPELCELKEKERKDLKPDQIGGEKKSGFID